MRREPTHANVADARHGYYFVTGGRGQCRAADFGGSSTAAATGTRSDLGPSGRLAASSCLQ